MACKLFWRINATEFIQSTPTVSKVSTVSLLSSYLFTLCRKIKEEEDQPDFDLGNLSDLPDPDVDETPLGRTCWIKEEPSSEEHVAETSTRILSTSTSASPSRLADDLEAKPSITYPDSTVCPTCSQPSPQVYRLAWACLNSTCSAFWLPLHTLSPELLYNPAFLQLRTGQPVTRTLDILPPPLETTSSNPTSYSFTRGMHCRKCGRLTSRLVPHVGFVF